MPETSVGAGTVATQTADVPAVEGYRCLGVVGANSWHGQLVYQAFEVSGSKVVVTLRNVASWDVSTTGSVNILYARE